jgi:NitT/TauT family transport system permease protein
MQTTRSTQASSTRPSVSSSTAAEGAPFPARPGAGDAAVPAVTGRRYLEPKEPIPRFVAYALSLASAAVVIGIWSVLSYTGIVEAFFLPSPSTVAQSLYDMFAHEDFIADVWASASRILLGFLIASVVAVPLGIAIGSYRVVQAFFEPGIAAVRYMPASAFIPLLIIWFGIGNNEKVAVIFIGTFFPLTLMVADVSANVSKELLNISYTLGASRWQVFRRVLLPACWPGVIDNLRIGIGWAWTYLIVAELVAASTGIGYVILTASRFGETEKIVGGIITIGVLGLLTDGFFRWLYRALFPYAERVAR